MPLTFIAPEVFDLVDRIAAANTIAQVWTAYLGAARQVGLDFGVICFMRQTRSTPSELIADHMPSGWLEDYREQELEAGDLLAPRAYNSNTSFEWRLTNWDSASLTAIQKRWCANNIAHGILGGLTIMDFCRADPMLLVVCGAGGVLDSHDRMALSFAGQEAIARLRELAVALPLPYAPLSRRERECLQWVSAGKTDWEIGQILCLSEKTVNVYVERAKTKFGVATRAQAVVRALRDGAIAAA